MSQNESQGAAAERAIFTWQERAASDPTRWSKSSPVRFMQAEIDDLRAALKAHPAPTEAQTMAFGEPFDPKDETIKRLQGLIEAYQQIIAGHESRDKRAIKYANSAQIANTEVQGEDSARLDAERYRFLRDSVADTSPWTPHGTVWVVRYNHQTGTIPVLESAGKGAELDLNIDRARARAETGGVKS